VPALIFLSRTPSTSPTPTSPALMTLAALAGSRGPRRSAGCGGKTSWSAPDAAAPCVFVAVVPDPTACEKILTHLGRWQRGLQRGRRVVLDPTARA
jgi:hypothetical protein